MSDLNETILNQSQPPLTGGVEIIDLLAFSLEGTAEWRRRKAEEYPDDDRNMKAAEEADRLALQLRELDGKNAAVTRYCALFDDVTDDILSMSSVVEGEALKDIGFRASFESAEDLLTSLADQLDEAKKLYA